MDVAVRRGALDEREVVVHSCVVVRGGAVSEAVVYGRGNQRSGERVRKFGCGGVVRFAQVVKMDVHGLESLRGVVKVKRDLVRAPLVVCVWRLVCQ